MTTKEAKNQIAKKLGYDEWKYFIRYATMDEQMTAEDEAMKLYAEEKCKKQRQICAGYNYAIEESPLPIFE